uniref:Cyclin-A1-1 n=1 Tax=Anthurium amnicola TaxID=1678845 RepID=A0A1D1YEE9_9ARAE
MAGASRRSSFAPSGGAAAPPPPSSLVKRPAAENAGKVSQAAQQQAKKRVALRNLSNQCSGSGSNPARPSTAKVKHKGSAAITVSSLKKGPDTLACDRNFHKKLQITSYATKPTSQTVTPQTSIKDGLPPLNDCSTRSVLGHLAPCSNVPSPTQSAGCSVSVDETMSTCDSMKSPDIEYIDNADSSAVASLERQASENLCISEHPDSAGHKWKKSAEMGMEALEVVDVDSNYSDPQMCATLACDIYNHLRMAETKRRPSADFMEVIQKDINASMRAILIDWLVEVAEEYRLVPDTLYLTVNYIDRYLSGNEMNRQHLQLLGVACMLIAAKYEEICAPQVEEFCYITDNTYIKEEVLQMEAVVLRYLKFEMTAPTAKCFLRRFVRAAQHSDEVPLLQLEFLASYLAELSLLEYSFLCYAPSLIAASAIFLAKFILLPTKRPWNATLRHYTLYQPSGLCACAKALHRLLCNSAGSSLPAIREKYSQHKYKFVAKKYCRPSIPSEYFQDLDI